MKKLAAALGCWADASGRGIAGFGAAFGPVVILSLYWRGMTRDGALAGMLVGAITVLVWKQYAWFGLYEMVPGFAFATIAIIVVSRLGRAPEAEVTARFDAVDLCNACELRNRYDSTDRRNRRALSRS